MSIPPDSIDKSKDWHASWVLPAAMVEARCPDAETVTFKSLADVIPKSSKKADQPLNVCIMTIDFVGPVRNGGIGTAYRYLADFLVSRGHKVTVLYGLGRNCENGTIEKWVSYYAKRKIEFVPMPDADVPSVRNGPLGRAMRISYYAYEWLKGQQFDVVHVSEWSGMGYASILAKKLGLHFHETLFAVKCSSPMIWNRLGGAIPLKKPEELVIPFIERRSVELADIVISGSLHLLRWMLEHGYDLDRDRCYVQPNIMLTSTLANLEESSNKVGDRMEIDEIVFFGRLEPRKGIHIFCDAISRLLQAGITPKRVTFLGKFSKHFDANEYISRHTKSWGIENRIINNFNQFEAIEFLRSENRLAVMPSVLENSSFAIYECLTYSIPFLVSNRGGSPELVHQDDHQDILFDAHPNSLAKCLRRAMELGALIPRPSFDNDKNLDIWTKWHQSLTASGQIKRLSGAYKPVTGKQKTQPLVTVCLAHYERPEMVWQAIRSLEQQTYKNFEVVMVDDGSPLPETQKKLDQIEEYFKPRGWRLVRQENLYLGASRNTAARNARGKFLLFMDDDNLAKPNEIETFVDVATRSDADLLTCYADVFDGLEEPVEAVHRTTPVGANLSFGFIRNGFGDSNFFIKASAFQRINGFGEDFRVGRDDQEFFARAVFSGCKLEVVPEALFWYRQPFGAGMKELNFSKESGQLRVANTYIKNAPLAFRNLFLYLIGLINSEENLRKEKKSLSAENQHLTFEVALLESIVHGTGHFSFMYGDDIQAFLNNSKKQHTPRSNCGAALILETRPSGPLLTGWAWDRADKDSMLHVVVVVNGKYACCVLANVFIAKLNNSSKGLGYHGFGIPDRFISLKAGDVLEAFILETGKAVRHTPCRYDGKRLKKLALQKAAKPVTAPDNVPTQVISNAGGAENTKLSVRGFVRKIRTFSRRFFSKNSPRVKVDGCVYINEELAYGWAWNKEDHSEFFSIDIIKGNSNIKTLQASTYLSRFDRRAPGLGQHGFTVPLDELGLKEGDVLNFVFSEEKVALKNSPICIIND